MRRFKNTLRQILVLFLISRMCTFTLPARGADVVVDPSIPAVNGTAIDTAQNGVTVINLAATSAGGVSHNRFTEYNVGPSGIILNNSREMGISVLGGALYGNPNYQGGVEASIVLNEVTGTKRSNLLGYTEMFGRSAEFILVNPNGIMCNGAGFINMPKVTLSTGTAVMDNGYFRGINVKDGTFSVEGAGIDARGVSYFEIITRMASLNGAIWGNDVNIKTGTGYYNYQSGNFEGGAGSGTKPEYAVDASALGSIYAGRISIISNDSGVGVRSQGDMIADVSDINISADGSIELKNVQSVKNIAVTSKSSSILQNGNVFALGNINYKAAGITNRGSIKSIGDFTLEGSFDNAGGVVASSGNIDLNTNGVINNTGGKITLSNDSGVINIHGNDDLTVYGGQIKSAGGINFNMTGDINLLDAGTLYADKYFTLNARRLTIDMDMSMNGSIEMNVLGDINTTQSSIISSNNNLLLQYYGKFTNSGKIRGKNITINGSILENTLTGDISGGAGNSVINISGDIDNYNRISSALNLAVSGGKIKNYNDMSEISAGGTLSLTGISFVNEEGLLFSGDDMNIRVCTLENNRGYILSMGDMTVTGNALYQNSLLNYSGHIESAGDMNIDLYSDGRLTNTGEDSGSYVKVLETVGERGDGSWEVMKQYRLDSTMVTESSYLVSGKNMTINAGDVLNHGSVISANNDITINANKFINETNTIEVFLPEYQLKGIREKHKKKIKVGKFSWTWKTYHDNHDKWVNGTVPVVSADKATVTAGGIIKINAATKVDNGVRGTSGLSLTGGTGDTSYNTSRTEDVKTTGAIDISEYVKIDGNGNALFKVNKEPGTTYLIETKIEYIDVSKLKGSQYLLDRIGFNPDKDVKFLGDAYYEQRIIMEAILKSTSERFLDDSIKNDQEQMTWLLDNAASAYRDLNLAVGVQLTKEQINSLQQPIIWYVEETIMGVNVLAPKIYIPEHIIDGFTKNNDSMITADKIIINTDGDLSNTGLIKGNTSVEITAGNITNATIGSTAEISGGEVDLTAENDILNMGGAIKSSGDLSITAVEGDVINETAVKTIVSSWGDVESRLGTTAVISSGGNLDIDAGGDFASRGAEVSAEGDAEIAAGGNIDFETVKLQEKINYTGADFKAVKETTTSVGSTLGVGGNLKLTSGRDINFIGSSADITGSADVNVEGNFNLLNDYNTSYYESTETDDDVTSSTTTHTVSTSKTVVGSAFNAGGDLNVESGNDINIVGSDINSGGNSELDASGALNIVAVYDESYYKQVSKKSGLGVGGAVWGSVKQSDMVHDSMVNDSTVSIKGNYASSTGGDTNIQGSSLNVGGTAEIETGGDLNIVAAYDKHDEEHKTEKTGFGTTDGDAFAMEVDASGKGSVTAVASVLNAGSLTVKSGNDVYIEGSDINAGNASFDTTGSFTETSAKETSYEYSYHEKMTAGIDLKTLVNPLSSLNFDQGRLSVKVGSAEYDNKKVTTENTTQRSSELNITDNLEIDSSKDITVAGSNINAGGDVTLNAANNVSIETTNEGTRTESEEISGKAEVTVGVKNAVSDVAYATKAVMDAKKALDKAKDDYDKYKDDLAKAKDDLNKKLIDQDDYDSMEAEEKYYIANVAMSVENVAAKTAALVQATISASATAGTYGFSADVQLKIDGSYEKTKSEDISSKGSVINAGGNFTVTAGNRAKIEGSDVTAGKDITLDAKSVDILAAENTSTSSTKSGNVSATISIGTASVGGPSYNGSASLTESSSDSTTYTNSHLSGSNIIIKSSEDTTVKGGVVTAENELKLEVDGDLTVQSLQDRSKNHSNTVGVSAGGSNSGVSSGGANANMSNGSKKWVTEQTSLTGGVVDIDVADNTTLKGAVIASTTGDLTLDTGSLEFSDIKDKDRSNNIGGGVSAGKDSKSVNATYGFSDMRQTNFATIGEGTITVHNEETDLAGLNRDVSISQYDTKNGGLQGGFTVDTTMVEMASNLADAVKDPNQAAKDVLAIAGKAIEDAAARTDKIIAGAIELEKQAEVIAEKTGNAISGDGYKTDEEVAADKAKAEEEARRNNIQNVSSTGGATDNSVQDMADQKIAEAREAAAKRGTPTNETNKVMEEAGWDGQPIENTKNQDVIDQTDKATLRKYGLPDKDGACVFLSTVYGAADALGITLSPEEVKKIYDAAEASKPPIVNGKNGTYGVDSYPGLVKAVADVKGIDSSNITCPNEGIRIKPNDDSSKQNAANEIVKTIKDGGAVEIRYDVDPTKPTGSAHTMRVTGSFIEDGNVILSIKDTYYPDKKTYVDTSTMTLYTLDKKNNRVPSDRPVWNYRPITNNKGN